MKPAVNHNSIPFCFLFLDILSNFRREILVDMSKKIILFFAVLTTIVSIASCNKQGPEVYTITSTVTYKTASDGTFFMEVNDSTAIIPLNLKEYPFKGSPEKRGMAFYFTEFATSKSIPGYKNSYDVTLSQFDTVYIKNPVVSTSSVEGDDALYGKDLIGIYLTGFPQTVIEDGYLYIPFVFRSGLQITHTINLVTGANPDDPYEVVLHHDAHGDTALSELEGSVNFPLKSLPDTHGQFVDLTLKWKSLVTGQIESTKLKYCSRTDWPQAN